LLTQFGRGRPLADCWTETRYSIDKVCAVPTNKFAPGTKRFVIFSLRTLTWIKFKIVTRTTVELLDRIEGEAASSNGGKYG